jgi:hypothetical protein
MTSSSETPGPWLGGKPGGSFFQLEDQKGWIVKFSLGNKKTASKNFSVSKYKGVADEALLAARAYQRVISDERGLTVNQYRHIIKDGAPCIEMKLSNDAEKRTYFDVEDLPSLLDYRWTTDDNSTIVKKMKKDGSLEFFKSHVRMNAGVRAKTKDGYIRMHYFIMKRRRILHINRNKFDNRRRNLSCVTIFPKSHLEVIGKKKKKKLSE